MSDRDYRKPQWPYCPRCNARLEPGKPHACKPPWWPRGEEPPQDQLVIDAFPEWDGSGPVPYNVIPY